MRDVFVVSDNIFSPLGKTSDENFDNLCNGISGVKSNRNVSISSEPFFASLFEKDQIILNEKDKNQYSKFEQLVIASLKDALSKSEVNINDGKTVLILSSTKGNIALLGENPVSAGLVKSISLSESAEKICRYFNHRQKPVIISNACISGLAAILVGKRLIQSGQYENAIVTGADVISKFIFSGFESFQALSSEMCKPFDSGRKGINLGEASATVILSSKKNKFSPAIKISGGSVSNDSNHISGPSLTGKELSQAIQQAMNEGGLLPEQINFISAHGTATIYNDEMEAKAITQSGLSKVPVNSLKPYFGHTLGAAGLVESVVTFHSMSRNIIIPNLGYQNSGVTNQLNINTELINTELNHCLKTASGFGGCNAALVFSKTSGD